ncbi:MAG TPA: MFS transporter [Ktedonobacterales bacterium]|nr:MFS transporter [Ktedonobacterales bacterium]
MAERKGVEGGRRDWALVVTLGVTETTSYGVLYYAFTVFLTPMQAELGWSRSALTGAFSLALLLSGVMGLFVGHWLDRHGPHALMSIGSCVAFALTLAWSHVHTLLIFYLIWAAIGVVMAAVLYEPAFWVVTRRFRRQRGRALTALTFIAGFASVIYVPLAGALVRAQGWRGALVTLAIILAIGTIPAHALALRGSADTPGALTPDPSPKAPAQAEIAPTQVESVTIIRSGMTRGEALRTTQFWSLTAAFFLITLSTSALTVHLVPLLQDRGYSQTYATSVAGVFALMALPGRLIFTPLGDRFRRSHVVASIFICHALGLLALLFVPGQAGVIGYVVLFGTGFGAIMPARASIVADFYGSAHYGKINSVVALATLLARALGPIGMSLVYDHVGGYPPALAALTLAALLGVVALALADSQPMRATMAAD